MLQPLRAVQQYELDRKSSRKVKHWWHN